MGMTIGNVGLLNMVNATEESIRDIEKIENVGLVLYAKETAPLLSKLNINNIGQTLETSHQARIVNGRLLIDSAFLEAMLEPCTFLVNGLVIVAKDVTIEQLKQAACQIVVNGSVYAPPALKGAVNLLLKTVSGSVETYTDHLPRIETGIVQLTNSYLEALPPSQHIIVTGKIELMPDLDMTLFSERIARLTINGKVLLYITQEQAFYEKASVVGKVAVVPSGFQATKGTLRLNEHSIKRFNGTSLYTTQPLLLQKGVSREQLKAAFAAIHSTSYIVCHEELEDLVYERLDRFETDVLSYPTACRFIEKEDWSLEDVERLEANTTIIVDDTLTITEKIAENVLNEKIGTLDLFGTIYTADAAQKALLQSKLRTPKGIMIDQSNQSTRSGMDNIGELTL
ncbi:hypothetical protein J26TS2_02800 [Shouchella clausii]|uniref:hypothetical protein n=1 Tax=Shouchella tritolerans TaxID=2979466 RepID=UPI0007882520|nr:hypothetical protein [Shouchella tritolerans]GIN10413.1 hypothetical protein J26TS2_02800 [Shouchella clausii]